MVDGYFIDFYLKMLQFRENHGLLLCGSSIFPWLCFVGQQSLQGYTVVGLW
jgi:hypothetical protein